MIKKLLLIALLPLVLVACGDDGPQVLRGPVIGREYDTPDTWNDYCIVSQKISEYSSVCILWHEAHDGPHWRLQLSCSIGDEDHRTWVEVGEHEYSRYNFNDSYPEEGDCLVEEQDSG